MGFDATANSPLVSALSAGQLYRSAAPRISSFARFGPLSPFVITTALSVALTTRFPASAVGALLLGGWLVKMVIALIVLVALKDADFYNRYALGLTILGALVVVLGAEVFGVVKTKVAYVDSVPAEDKTDDR